MQRKKDKAPEKNKEKKGNKRGCTSERALQLILFNYFWIVLGVTRSFLEQFWTYLVLTCNLESCPDLFVTFLKFLSKFLDFLEGLGTFLEGLGCILEVLDKYLEVLDKFPCPSWFVS